MLNYEFRIDQTQRTLITLGLIGSKHFFHCNISWFLLSIFSFHKNLKTPFLILSYFNHMLSLLSPIPMAKKRKQSIRDTLLHEEIWCVGKCLITSSVIFSTCPFLRHKIYHQEWFQSTNMESVNSEFEGENANNRVLTAARSQL